MTSIVLCAVGILLFASLILLSHRRAPRDLRRADPDLTLSYRLTRWAGGGLVFVATIQLMNWLWWGVWYSIWSRDWMIAMPQALTGVAIMWRLSARRETASADRGR